MNDKDWEELSEDIREASQDVNSPWFDIARDESHIRKYIGRK